MAKYVSADGKFSSDNPAEINTYNATHTDHSGGGVPEPAGGEFGYDAADGTTPNLGVSFGGNPGTPVPGHPSLTIGPDGQVHDLTAGGAFNGTGSTSTDLNLYDPRIGVSNIGDAAGLNNLGEPVTNDPTQGNVPVGNEPLGFAPGVSGTSATGIPHTADGTLVPGLANTSDLKKRDPRDYQYGRRPEYGQQVVGQARTQAAAFGDESRALGQTAADTGNQYATQTAAAGQRGQEVGAGVQSALTQDAQLAAARGAATNATLQNQGAGAQNTGAAVNAALTGAGQTAAGIGGDANAALTGLEATEGPSAAQAQLASATSQGMGDALTLARSGRGPGGNAAALAQAGARMPGMAANAANKSAEIRANETALWRARQAGNIATGANTAIAGQNANINALTAGGNAALEGAGMNIGATTAGGKSAIEGMQTSIGAKTAGGQAALAGTSQAAQGAATGGQLSLGGLQQQTGNVQNAQGQFWQGESLADKVTGAQTAQDLAYENMLTQKAGIDAGIAINAANNEQSIWPAVIGAGATGLAMMASDERNKDVDHEVKLSSAIHGNPYGRTGAPGKMKGPKSDLSPYGIGPMGGQQNYAAAQGADQRIAAKNEAAQEARLQAAIRAAGSIAQSAATPRQNNGQAGQSMIDNAMRFQPMQPVVSDERSKSKISDLESQLAAARVASPDFRKSPNYAYTYKDPTIPGAAPGPQVGTMAQDLERAGSEAVVNTPTGKMVEPERLVMEVAGVQGEQQARQDDLERQFAELEAMMRAPRGPKSRGNSASMQ